MKKIILTSISCLLGLTLVACSNKTTTKKTDNTTNAKTTTNKTTKTVVTTKKATTTNKKEPSYIRVGDDIYFGVYPQELVIDETRIEELNSNTSSWNSYKYYADNELVEYMFYKDIDVDNDGKYDFRGVKFSQFRPYLIGQPAIESMSYVDENGYEKDKTYWFRYSSIKWNILEESGMEMLIASELLLDSQEIYHNTQSGKYDHNDGNGYSNNYDLSNIIKWLNDSFYNLAFTEVEKEYIKKENIYTDATPSKYTSGPVEYNMFLLSKNEANVFYASDEARRAKGTDYAKIQGLHVNSSIVNTGYSEWWVRTPSYNSDYNTITIDTDGTINGNGINDNNTAMGIRVACVISA